MENFATAFDRVVGVNEIAADRKRTRWKLDGKDIRIVVIRAAYLAVT